MVDPHQIESSLNSLQLPEKPEDSKVALFHDCWRKQSIDGLVDSVSEKEIVPPV